VAVSGSGNVAQYAIEKATQFGAKVVTASDSDGSIYDPAGITKEKLAFFMELKNVKRGRIEEYAKKFKGSTYRRRVRVVGCGGQVRCRTALRHPERAGRQERENLVKKGVKYVAEGANMPTTPEAIEVFASRQSGLRAGQGQQRRWCCNQRLGDEPEQPAPELDPRRGGCQRCTDHEEHPRRLREARQEGNTVNYVKGANIAGFVKVADAMLDQGVV
jgi:glutamate dehydrogenase (NADP+)